MITLTKKGRPITTSPVCTPPPGSTTTTTSRGAVGKPAAWLRVRLACRRSLFPPSPTREPTLEGFHGRGDDTGRVATSS